MNPRVHKVVLMVLLLVEVQVEHSRSWDVSGMFEYNVNINGETEQDQAGRNQFEWVIVLEGCPKVFLNMIPKFYQRDAIEWEHSRSCDICGG